MDWMVKAHQMAGNSPDPSTKVGAVLVTSVGAMGAWNDFPPGIPDEWWEDRPKKYLAVVHAEMSVLLFAGRYAHGSTMFVTHHHCRDCAKLIAASGVVRVVCPGEPWRDDPAVIENCKDAASLLEACGVEVCHYGSQH